MGSVDKSQEQKRYQDILSMMPTKPGKFSLINDSKQTAVERAKDNSPTLAKHDRLGNYETKSVGNKATNKLSNRNKSSIPRGHKVNNNSGSNKHDHNSEQKASESKDSFKRKHKSTSRIHTKDKKHNTYSSISNDKNKNHESKNVEKIERSIEPVPSSEKTSNKSHKSFKSPQINPSVPKGPNSSKKYDLMSPAVCQKPPSMQSVANISAKMKCTSSLPDRHDSLVSLDKHTPDMSTGIVQSPVTSERYPKSISFNAKVADIPNDKSQKVLSSTKSSSLTFPSAPRRTISTSPQHPSLFNEPTISSRAKNSQNKNVDDVQKMKNAKIRTGHDYHFLESKNIPKLSSPKNSFADSKLIDFEKAKSNTMATGFGSIKSDSTSKRKKLLKKEKNERKSKSDCATSVKSEAGIKSPIRDMKYADSETPDEGKDKLVGFDLLEQPTNEGLLLFCEELKKAQNIVPENCECDPSKTDRNFHLCKQPPDSYHGLAVEDPQQFFHPKELDKYFANDVLVSRPCIACNLDTGCQHSTEVIEPTILDTMKYGLNETSNDIISNPKSSFMSIADNFFFSLEDEICQLEGDCYEKPAENELEIVGPSLQEKAEGELILNSTLENLAMASELDKKCDEREYKIDDPTLSTKGNNIDGADELMIKDNCIILHNQKHWHKGKIPIRDCTKKSIQKGSLNFRLENDYIDVLSTNIGGQLSANITSNNCLLDVSNNSDSAFRSMQATNIKTTLSQDSRSISSKNFKYESKVVPKYESIGKGNLMHKNTPNLIQFKGKFSADSHPRILSETESNQKIVISKESKSHRSSLSFIDNNSKQKGKSILKEQNQKSSHSLSSKGFTKDAKLGTHPTIEERTVHLAIANQIREHGNIISNTITVNNLVISQNFDHETSPLINRPSPGVANAELMNGDNNDSDASEEYYESFESSSSSISFVIANSGHLQSLRAKPKKEPKNGDCADESSLSEVKSEKCLDSSPPTKADEGATKSTSMLNSSSDNTENNEENSQKQNVLGYSASFVKHCNEDSSADSSIASKNTNRGNSNDLNLFENFKYLNSKKDYDDTEDNCPKGGSKKPCTFLNIKNNNEVASEGTSDKLQSFEKQSSSILERDDTANSILRNKPLKSPMFVQASTKLQVMTKDKAVVWPQEKQVREEIPLGLRKLLAKNSQGAENFGSDDNEEEVIFKDHTAHHSIEISNIAKEKDTEDDSSTNSCETVYHFEDDGTKLNDPNIDVNSNIVNTFYKSNTHTQNKTQTSKDFLQNTISNEFHSLKEQNKLVSETAQDPGSALSRIDDIKTERRENKKQNLLNKSEQFAKVSLSSGEKNEHMKRLYEIGADESRSVGIHHAEDIKELKIHDEPELNWNFMQTKYLKDLDDESDTETNNGGPKMFNLLTLTNDDIAGVHPDHSFGFKNASSQVSIESLNSRDEYRNNYQGSGNTDDKEHSVADVNRRLFTMTVRSKQGRHEKQAKDLNTGMETQTMGFFPSYDVGMRAFTAPALEAAQNALFSTGSYPLGAAETHSGHDKNKKLVIHTGELKKWGRKASKHVPNVRKNSLSDQEQLGVETTKDSTGQKAILDKQIESGATSSGISAGMSIGRLDGNLSSGFFGLSQGNRNGHNEASSGLNLSSSYIKAMSSPCIEVLRVQSESDDNNDGNIDESKRRKDYSEGLPSSQMIERYEKSVEDGERKRHLSAVVTSNFATCFNDMDDFVSDFDARTSAIWEKTMEKSTRWKMFDRREIRNSAIGDWQFGSSPLEISKNISKEKELPKPGGSNYNSTTRSQESRILGSEFEKNLRSAGSSKKGSAGEIFETNEVFNTITSDSEGDEDELNSGGARLGLNWRLEETELPEFDFGDFDSEKRNSGREIKPTNSDFKNVFVENSKEENVEIEDQKESELKGVERYGKRTKKTELNNSTRSSHRWWKLSSLGGRDEHPADETDNKLDPKELSGKKNTESRKALKGVFANVRGKLKFY